SHKTRPIYRKDNRQILQSHIMYDLVISSLEEGRIHGKYGFDPPCRQSGSKGDRMALRDPHVKKPSGKAAPELGKPGAVSHGSGDDRHFRISFPYVTDYFRKYIRIGIFFCSPEWFPCLNV